MAPHFGKLLSEKMINTAAESALDRQAMQRSLAAVSPQAGGRREALAAVRTAELFESTHAVAGLAVAAASTRLGRPAPRLKSPGRQGHSLLEAVRRPAGKSQTPSFCGVETLFS